MSDKVVAYRAEEYLVEVQPFGDEVHLHINVFEWKPSVLKQLYLVFAELKAVLTEKGFSSMKTISPNPKFAKLFGGKTTEELFIDGVYYEVIVWDLIH